MKKTIRGKLFSFCIFLVLFTSISISIPYYIITRQEKQAASQVRIRIAFDIIRDDILNRIKSQTLRFDEFFRQVSAIPWELSWYNKTKDKIKFFSDPTYSAYITTIGEEFHRFSRFISANRLLLYGIDKRLLVSYHRDKGIEHVGAYIVNQDKKNSYLSLEEYSKNLITRQPLPEVELPASLKAHLGRDIPDKIVSEHFQDGSRLGLRTTAPIYHKGKKVGALIAETLYTQRMVERYAQLSHTEIDVFAGSAWSIGTLPVPEGDNLFSYAHLKSSDSLLKSKEKKLDISSVKVGTHDYYQGCFAFIDSKGQPVGAIIVSLPQDIEKSEIRKMLKAILLIALLVIFIAFALIVIISRKTLHSIQKLTTSTSEIANGNLEMPINISGEDELGRLAKSFAKMREAIIKQIAELKSEIKERQQTAKELQESEDRLSATLCSIGDGVITCDISGVVQSLNRAAEHFTGWKAAEAAGRPVGEVFHIVNAQTREKAANPVWHALREGEIVGLANHTVLIARDKTEYQIADSCAPIIDAAGVVFGAVLVFRDVTEEYALQEQLRQSQKLDAIGQLAGGVAHDFNNMLGGIMGAAELMRNQFKDDPKSVHLLAMIIKSVERAADLAKKLLAFSRRQAAGSTPIDVHKVIMDVVSLLKNTCDKRIEIQGDLLAEASLVVGDNAQLQSVFLNLGINASHAMPNGGSLLFRSTLVDLSEAYCSTSSFELKPGTYIEVEVRDTGCGIDQNNITRIFEPFFTTKEQGKGTGLGLAAAYGTICQHKGAINVYSEENRGTSFHLLLPLSEDAVEIAPQQLEAVRGEGVILLVDDEAVMRVTGKALLEELGYDVLLAENGKQAADIFNEKAKDIDLVILDMIMPEMNGRDCFYAIKEIRADVPIILASGFSRKEDLADLREHGLNGFIQKPFRGAELSQVVAEAIKNE